MKRTERNAYATHTMDVTGGGLFERIMLKAGRPTDTLEDEDNDSVH